MMVALGSGSWRRLTDGKAKRVRRGRGPRLDVGMLQADLGAEATLVQFSSRFCAPCRATQRLLADVGATVPTVSHIDIDAETRLDLVECFGITRTPTVLLEAGGAVRRRLTGAARKTEVLGTLSQVIGQAITWERGVGLAHLPHGRELFDRNGR